MLDYNIIQKKYLTFIFAQNTDPIVWRAWVIYKFYRLLSLWQLSAKMHQVLPSNSITGDHMPSMLCHHYSPFSFIALRTLAICFLGDCLITDYNFQAIKTGSSNNWAPLFIYFCFGTENQLESFSAVGRKDFQLWEAGIVNTVVLAGKLPH